MRFSIILKVIVLSFALLGARSAWAYDVEVLQQSGDPDKRVNLLIMGDGYRTVDQTKMTNDAKNLLNGFWAQEGFARYKNFFNIKLVHVISNQDGADNGTLNQQRDTALGAYFGCQQVDRLLCVNDDVVYAVAARDAPMFNQILVIVNDNKYGGAGGRGLATTSVHSSARDIAVHEVGHSLLGLADEYEDSTIGWFQCDSVFDCSEPNASVFSDRNRIKWKGWIDASTPLPTPELDPRYKEATVGAFEGVRYFPNGQYRPWDQCIMRQLTRPFCPVCREQTVLSLYNYSGLIDSWSPAGPVTMTRTQQVVFSTTGPRPVPDTVVASWLLDGQLVPNATSTSLTLSGANLSLGSHTLEAVLKDQTPFVRRDDQNLTQDRRLFEITVQNEGALLIDANFNTDSNGFSYLDNVFRGTTQGNYATGSRIASGGFAGGALEVRLGGIDDTTVNGMSGGFRTSFSLSSSSKIKLSVRYNVTQTHAYETDEFSEAMVAVDNVLYGTSGKDYIERVTGDAAATNTSRSTGWDPVFEVVTGVLAAGSHTLTIGGYNNKKTLNDESTSVRIDDVKVMLNP